MARPRLPSAKVQIVAGHLAYYLARGFDENQASELLIRDFGAVPYNTLYAALAYAQSAAFAFHTQEVYPRTATIDQLYGGADSIPVQGIGLRVLATYRDANGNTIRQASKVVQVTGDQSIQDAFDIAESQLSANYDSARFGTPSFSIIASVPFPPQSAQ